MNGVTFACEMVITDSRAMSRIRRTLDRIRARSLKNNNMMRIHPELSSCGPPRQSSYALLPINLSQSSSWMKIKKTLYGLRTSLLPWKIQKDATLSNLTANWVSQGRPSTTCSKRRVTLCVAVKGSETLDSGVTQGVLIA